MKSLYFFAQADIGNVPAEFIKWFLAIAFALVVIAGIVVGIVVAFRKQKVAIDPQPVTVRKAPKRFNHDQNEERHKQINQTLADHELRIRELELTTAGMEDRINAEGERRKAELQQEIACIPSRIIADLANMQKIK